MCTCVGKNRRSEKKKKGTVAITVNLGTEVACVAFFGYEQGVGCGVGSKTP